jgi:hypothetical protein
MNPTSEDTPAQIREDISSSPSGTTAVCSVVLLEEELEELDEEDDELESISKDDIIFFTTFLR